MQNKWIKLAALMMVSGLALGASCQTMQGDIGRIGSEITGDSRTGSYISAGIKAGQALTIGDNEEAGFGEAIALKLTNSPGLITDDKAAAYVQKVGLAVASASGRDDFPFVFGVLNDDRLNAVSAPRGYVFITNGLLRQMQDESELAGVLAHEIAHVVKGHGLATVKSEGLFDAAKEAGMASLTTQQQLVRMTANIADRWASPTASNLYSQGQEDEADRLAVQYLKAAGYNPEGFARVMERVYGTRTGVVMSSHPAAGDRVRRIRAAIGGTPGGQTLADRFSANVAR